MGAAIAQLAGMGGGAAGAGGAATGIGAAQGIESWGGQSPYLMSDAEMFPGEQPIEGLEQNDYTADEFGSLMGGQGAGGGGGGGATARTLAYSSSHATPERLPPPNQSIAGLMALVNRAGGGQRPHQGFNQYQNPYMTGLMKF